MNTKTANRPFWQVIAYGFAALAVACFITSIAYAGESNGNGNGEGNGTAEPNPQAAAAVNSPESVPGCNVTNDPDSGLGTCFYDVTQLCLFHPQDGRTCDWTKDPRFLRAH